MWIRGIDIVRYGRLTDLRVGCGAGTGPDGSAVSEESGTGGGPRVGGKPKPDRPLGDLVAVVGPNESGKSTLFAFLSAMLYGFYPASRDTHPHTPWEGGEIEGSLDLELREGRRLRVHRRLLSSPRGSLQFPDREEDLRNRTLPAATHVPREIFDGVYTVTLAELAAIGERGSGSWELIQDRLLIGLGARDFRSPREVAQELEMEAGTIWRTSARGNQEIRDLDERISSLKGRRREAAERDRELRRWVRELEERRLDLEEAREERERLVIRIERIERLLPLRGRLRRIQELREIGGPANELEGLPEAPEARLEELDREQELIEADIARMAAEREEMEEAASALTPELRTLLESEERVRRLCAEASGAGGLRDRLDSLRQEVREARRRCERTARELLSTPFDEIDEGALRSIPLDRLRQEAAVHRRLDHRLRVRREAERMAPTTAVGSGTASALGVTAFLFLLAGVLVVAGLLRDDPLLWLVGGAAAVAGVLQWLTARRRGGEPLEGAGGDRGSGSEEREMESVRERVLSLFGELPVRSDALDDPGRDLGRDVGELVESVETLRERRARLEKLEERSSELRLQLDEVAAGAKMNLPEDTAAASHLLEQALDRARDAGEEARSAERELTRLAKSEERAASELRAIQEKKSRLHDALTSIGDGDPEAGAAAVRERLEALAEARALERDTRREFPDLDSQIERIREAEAAGEEWTDDDEARARAKGELKGLDDRIEALQLSMKELSTRIEERSGQETVDRIDGAIAEREETRSRLVEERDRKWLLARILREADRRFRDAHQPDVIRRAGRYLELVTGGRYDRIVLSDDPDGAPLRLQETGSGRRVAPGSDVDRTREGVSRGTRDQLYLSLRLAAVDHIDADGEPLPLFIDEAFVNWDETRRGRGFALLDEISRTRQLFVFTCHEETAAALAGRGADLIRMPGVEDRTGSAAGPAAAGSPDGGGAEEVRVEEGRVEEGRGRAGGDGARDG